MSGFKFDSKIEKWVNEFSDAEFTQYRASVLDFLNQLHPYFRKAKEESEYWFVWTLMRNKFNTPTNFDPFETIKEVKFATEIINKKFNTWRYVRYHYDLFNYCSIVEADELYALVFNLIRTIKGLEYSPNPFFQLQQRLSAPYYDEGEMLQIEAAISSSGLKALPNKTKDSLLGNSRKILYPYDKFGEIKRQAKTLSLPKIGYATFYDTSLRNGIVHSNYMIDDNADVLVFEKFDTLKTFKADTLLKMINSANAYRDAILFLYEHYKKSYVSSVILEGSGSYLGSKARVIVKEGEGLVGLQEISGPVEYRYRVGKFTRKDLRLILNGIYKLPENRNKIAQRIIYRFPRRAQPFIAKRIVKLFKEI